MDSRIKKPFLQFLGNGKVFINLPERRRKKRIMLGKIIPRKKTFYSIKKSKKHLFRKTNSLSLSSELVEKKNSGFIYICMNYENKKLWSSRLALMKFGHVLHFKHQGFEKQIFLPLDRWHNNKSKAKVERIKIKKGVI